MEINNAGLQLIKTFEGCVLHAYKPVQEERYYTIGYGHYGADVQPNATITQAQADNLLKADLKKYEHEVNTLGLNFNENQFSALVSFCYNCGAGALRTLTNNRNNAQIAEALLLYVNGANGRLEGLVRRREAEKKLFLTPIAATTKTINYKTYDVAILQQELNKQFNAKLVVDNIAGPKTLNACITVKQGAKGNITKWIQNKLNVLGYKCGAADGIFGNNTKAAVMRFQHARGIAVDGVVGKNTWKRLLNLT